MANIKTRSRINNVTTMKFTHLIQYGIGSFIKYFLNSYDEIVKLTRSRINYVTSVTTKFAHLIKHKVGTFHKLFSNKW